MTGSQLGNLLTNLGGGFNGGGCVSANDFLYVLDSTNTYLRKLIFGPLTDGGLLVIVSGDYALSTFQALFSPSPRMFPVEGIEDV